MKRFGWTRKIIKRLQFQLAGKSDGLEQSKCVREGQSAELSELDQRQKEEEAQLSSLRTPDDLSAAQQLVALLLKHGKPLPDDIHLNAARLGLRDSPFDMDLTLSAVGCLLRQDRPPVPSELMLGEKANHALPVPDLSLDELIALADGYWIEGNCAAAYVALWQTVVRYPASARGWAEYARLFSDSGQFKYAKDAVTLARSFPIPLDAPTFSVLAHVLTRITESGTLILPQEEYLAFADTAPDDTSEVQAARSHLLRLGGATRKAVAAADLAVSLSDASVSALLASFLAHYSAGEFEQSYHALVAAVMKEPVKVVREVTRSYGGQLLLICKEVGKCGELAEWLTDNYDHTLGHCCPVKS